MQPSRKAFESRKLHSCPSTTLNCSSERISDRKKGSDELIFPLFSADSFVIARSMKTGFPQRKRLTGELLLYNQLTNFTRKHNNRFPKFDTSLHFQNPQINRGMIPTLRAKTKYRLAKYRYTVNLSKDQARIDNYLLKQRFSQRGP